MEVSLLVEMLVCGIKIRRAKNQHRHLPTGPVPYTGGNEDCSLGSYGMRLAIEFDIGIIAAFQDDINLRVILVVMFARITADMCQMNGSRKFFAIGKCSAGDAAGAFDRRQGSQIDDDRFGWHVIELSG